jgi:hypothetical protein
LEVDSRYFPFRSGQRVFLSTRLRILNSGKWFLGGKGNGTWILHGGSMSGISHWRS